MSGVHDAIARAAYDVLPPDEQEILAPHLEALLAASWYPDMFADRAMPPAARARIDPQADALIYPDPPAEAWYQKLLGHTEAEERTGLAPMRSIYLAEHYVHRVQACLAAGEAALAAKLMGVWSHVIGDTAEPIHAVAPEVVDLVLPPPAEMIALELHANVEGLGAPVDIAGHAPRLLGSTPERAAMGACADLVAAKRLGAAQAVPIVRALYAGDRAEARRRSQLAQNAAARHFADFMHTMIELWRGRPRGQDGLDLCEYPFVWADVDMLYRHRPLTDASPIPYSGGKAHPLALPAGDGDVEQVHGLGVLPFLGPPFSPTSQREAVVEYCLVPGAYQTFRARVGANPRFAETLVSAAFTVGVDGEERFRSAEVGIGDAPASVEVSVAGARWLRLGMHYTAEPTRDDVARLHCAWALHGVWAEPQLIG